MTNTKPPQIMKPYHPGLASIEEAKADYSKVFSDHLPILTTVPCGENKAGLKEITLISWNVLYLDNGNGFAPNKEKNYNETNEQALERYDRIAGSLEKFADNHKPQFIALQEILTRKDSKEPLSHVLFEKINEKLSKDYAYITDAGGCITFYRKDQFNPILCDKSEEGLSTGNAGGNVTKFQLSKDTDFEIRVANVHHRFTENITRHEESIKKFLSGTDRALPALDKNKHTLSIMLGDFNGSVAQLNNQLNNNTTSVSPSIFRMQDGEYDPEIQKAWDQGLQVQGAWGIIDACFYSLLKKNQDKDFIYRQANIIPLNPITGTPYTKKELAPLSTTGLPLLQQKEINKYRMVICVDHSYQTEGILKINKEWQSIFTYENILQQMFKDNSICVRRAANLNNEKGLGIILNRELYYYFLFLRHRHFSASAKIDINGDYIFPVFTSDKNIPRLVRELQFAAENQQFIDFANKIGKLDQANKRLKREMQEKAQREKVAFDQAQFEQVQKVNEETLDAFKQLFTDIGKEPNRKKEPYLTILEHFSGLADRLLKDEKITLEEVQKSADDLDKKLSTKRHPMSYRMRRRVGAVIGALVGLAIGAVIGFGLTAWAGGFGAIPGLIIGATIGAGIGSPIGAGAGVKIADAISFFGPKDSMYRGILKEKEKIFKSLKNEKKENKPK